MTEPRVVVVTTAQRRVLGELTRDGASNATIARRLGVSPETVKCHVRAILASFGVRERTAVVVLCLRGEVVVRTVRQANNLRSRAPRPPINHGTHGGHQAHKRRGIEPCEPCAAASSEYMRWVRSKIKGRAA